MRTTSRRRSAVMAASAALAAAAGLVAATIPAQAVPEQTQAVTHHYSFHAKSGAGAITPHWVTGISAAMVEEYTTELRMQWAFSPHPGRSDVAMVNRQSGLCLEADGIAPVLAPCDGALAQGWHLIFPAVPSYPNHNYVGLRNAQTQSALTVAAPGWAGTPLRMETYAGLDSQRFDIVWRGSS
jgi:hypothetical protein